MTSKRFSLVAIKDIVEIFGLGDAVENVLSSQSIANREVAHYWYAAEEAIDALRLALREEEDDDDE